MLDLFKAIGLGLVVLLPLANPLTTVALFLGLEAYAAPAQLCGWWARVALKRSPV